MLDRDYFESLEPWYEVLKKSGLPVFIYGMGDGCVKLLKEFKTHAIKCGGIFASDDFARGNEFAGFKVKRLSDVESGYSDFCVAAAFGTSLPEVMGSIRNISKKHTLVFPDTPVIGEEVFTKEGFLERFADAEKFSRLLADDISRAVFENVLSFKITGSIDYLDRIFTLPDEAYTDILRLSENEIYADLGAYTGDTVKEFLSFAGGFRKIYIFEPNGKNFRKCVKNLMYLDNVSFYNCPAWKKDLPLYFDKGEGRQAQISDKGVSVYARSLDSVLAGGECTYIKYDVEGAETEAIEGSSETIKNYSPKICTALYHRAYDMLDIPLLIHRIDPDYKLYIRQYPYYPAWETNLFAVK
ncbi:FkbM family methyltransferase [Ruminococcus sp. Marseille-P6503]|uniref:FkbM family methyltransferase n=1 Tax=Ruminococcus sp. Marseille-P6503 TaxID=2364796 RepID=UPI000F539E72|nr:FkbM family methyltransferase [Ruminococcus sp. Marseille-P6503]